MFTYFLKITLKNFNRRGLFPIINILGLSIGLAVLLLISLLNFYEQSFDKGFKESKNIYRVNAKMTAIMPGETIISTPNALAPAMKDAIPEVIAAVRTSDIWFNLVHKENLIDIKITWADSDFFRLFDTPFIHGRHEDVMSRPNTVAISEEIAKRFFGNNNPIGETLTHTGWNQPPMEIVAVFKDYPSNSSLKEIKAVAPFMFHYQTWTYENLHWGSLNFETFFLLSANADTASVNAKMRKTLFDATEGQWDGGGWFFYPQLQRLEDIHLHSTKFLGLTIMSSLSDIGKVKMLTLLSVIILLVACVNYMNLSTARAQKRSKEIGISKTVGAKRSELILRLMFETAIFTFISFVVAWVLAWVALPLFNMLMNEQLEMVWAFQPIFLCIAFLIWIVTTLLAASYPAIYLSSFPPLMAIRNQHTPQSSHAIVRKVLTVGQFAVAVVLIVWVLVIQAQIAMVSKKELGYNYRNLVGVWIHDDNPDAMMNDYRAESSVEMVSRSNSNFFDEQLMINSLFRNADDQQGASLATLSVDPNYINLLEIKLIAGKNFTEQQPGDTIYQVLLNRAAVDYLGKTPEEAIGTRINAHLGGPVNEVYGVVENFHFQSLHAPIGGFCFVNAPWQKRFLMLRVKEGNLSEQLLTYEAIYKKYFPNNNFGAIFPEEYVARIYDSERRTGQIAVVFSILAILVACMGVFGLTAFMAEQRTKEIGIRKVLGASVWNIASLFTNNYAKLLSISLVISIPVAWWVGVQYLQNFAFRISLSWWIFVVAALITVVLTLITVGALAIKAAMRNPVEAIKTE